MHSLLLIGKNGGWQQRCLSGPSWPKSANVDAMEVVGPKSRVALGTLALPGIVAGLHAFKAEDMEALGEHGVLLAHIAAGAGQAGL